MARIRLPEGIPGISGQWPSGLKLQAAEPLAERFSGDRILLPWPSAR